MDYLKIAKSVLAIEAQALMTASNRLKESEIHELVEVYKYLKETGGSLVFCGVGKSGLIASKLASTFSSLGLPSFFLHPTEALHGDLGRLTKSDAVVFLSKSGTTEEILKLMPYLPSDPSLFIGLIGNQNSLIAKKCKLNFDCTVEKEACLNNQAPTTSSTLALAMGDAMAVVYESWVGLSKEGFAVNHPGGKLGKSLRLKVSDLMIDRAHSPLIGSQKTLQDLILLMTKFPVGACAVIDQGDELVGIVVEGDIRRTFTKENSGLETKIEKIMNRKPITVGPEILAYEALEIMEKRKNPISILPVVSADNKFLGILRLHDLLKEGLFLEKE